jgi:hypothetical protein
MAVNRKYKSTVFSLLFSEPKILGELYGALEGLPPAPESAIEINTLSEVLIWGKLNDLSFTVGNKLMILIEQQSTINPNMPLRLFLYCARLYEKMTEGRSLYSTRLIKIPWPECIVFYNGKAEYPDEETLRLSAAFEDVSALGLKRDPPTLELTAKVYNINEGRNNEPLAKSETLAQYSAFVSVRRKYEARYPHDKEKAMREALKHCMDHNILKAFLEKHSGEVLGMILEEWDDDMALAVLREETFEEGMEKGIEKGIEKGREEGRRTQMRTARNLLALGLSPEQVAQSTGLDIEVIKSLSSE